MKELRQCLVLLVDDVKDNINILVEALRDEYRLGFALNGESALKFAPVPFARPDPFGYRDARPGRFRGLPIPEIRPRHPRYPGHLHYGHG